MYDKQRNRSGISGIITRVRSSSDNISDIPRLMSLLIVLSTYLTTNRRIIVGCILKRPTVIRLSNLLLPPTHQHNF
jgi:hypothetical protein